MPQCKDVDTIFLTGITGTVGSWLAGEALSRGTRVSALVRGDSDAPARRRVDAVLNIVGAGEFSDRVQIVRGDLCREGFAIDAGESALPDFSLIIHCAACTEFQNGSAERSYITNVEGTRRVLELAASRKVPIVHISTAYVAGRRCGLVTEDELDTGHDFNNVYERTKCQAETLVHRWSARTGLPAIILRPGIVVGDSRRGHAVRFNAVYDMMRVFDILAPALDGEELRVIGRAEAAKNIVPVDYLARTAWQIITRAVPGVYHITHPAPVTVADLRDFFSRMFDVEGIRLVDPSDFDRRRPTRAERLCRSVSSIYEYHMRAEPLFDRRNTDRALAGTDIETPVVDLDFFRRLLDYARMVDWGRRPERVSQQAGNIPAAVERYFGDFLAAKIHHRLLPDLRKLTVTFRIAFKQANGVHWTLEIVKGVLRSISQNGVAGQCTYLLDVPTFRRIVAGRLAPQQAFFDRHIDIEGDIETALRTAAVLAAFFRQFPYQLETA